MFKGLTPSLCPRLCLVKSSSRLKKIIRKPRKNSLVFKETEETSWPGKDETNSIKKEQINYSENSINSLLAFSVSSPVDI